jgi:hypothetical protein
MPRSCLGYKCKTRIDQAEISCMGLKIVHSTWVIGLKLPRRMIYSKLLNIEIDLNNREERGNAIVIVCMRMYVRVYVHHKISFII